MHTVVHICDADAQPMFSFCPHVAILLLWFLRIIIIVSRQNWLKMYRVRHCGALHHTWMIIIKSHITMYLSQAWYVCVWACFAQTICCGTNKLYTVIMEIIIITVIYYNILLCALRLVMAAVAVLHCRSSNQLNVLSTNEWLCSANSICYLSLSFSLGLPKQ